MHDQASTSRNVARFTVKSSLPAAVESIVDAFNRGKKGAGDVLRVASFCIKKLGADVEGVRAVLKELGHTSHPRTGETVFPNTITYCAAISAYGKAGDAGGARALFDHLLEHGPARGVFPDNITYCAAISAYGKAGDAGGALALFDHLLERGPARDVFPDSITYNAVISACEKANRPKDVDRLLDDGIARNVFRPSLGFNAAENKLDLHENAVVTRPTRAGRASGIPAPVARAIFDRLRRKGITDQTTQYVVGQHGAGQLSTAIEDRLLQLECPTAHPYDAQGRLNKGVLVAVTVLPREPIR